MKSSLQWTTGASLRVAGGAGVLFALTLATHPPWYALAQGTQPTPLSTPSTTAPTATPLPLTEADVASLVAPSVVQVVTASGSASGVKVVQGVLTNNHVAAGGDQIEVVRSDGTRREARVVRTDPLYDLALLATDLDVPRLDTEAARRHRQGDPVLAIGYPFGPVLTGPPTVSRGVLSAVREAEGVVYVQTDAAMDFGSSGSAIVDMRGKLIGVAAGGLGLSGGLNLGVATESIQDFLNGVPLLGPDAAEPDDTLEQARPLQIDAQPERRSLHIPGDVDWVSLSLAGDESVAVFTESSHCDTYLQFYDSDGTLLAEDDDGGENGGSRLAFTALEAGAYYARVSHFAATGICRSYDLAAQNLPALEASAPGA